MRIDVELDDRQLGALDELARRDGRARAAVILAAVDAYLARRRRIDDAFGLWGKRKVDGSACREKARSDW